MSYRTLKRVLGETSLERKCRFLFGGGLVLLISGSFFLYGKLNNRIIADQDRERARLLITPRLLTLHWAAEQRANTGDDSASQAFRAMLEQAVAESASDLEQAKPESAEPKAQPAEPETRVGDDPTENSSANTEEKTAVESEDSIDEPDPAPVEPDDAAAEQNAAVAYKWALFSPDPEQADALKRPSSDEGYEAVERIVRGQASYEYSDRETGEYHYFAAIRASESCLSCHRRETEQKDLQRGDLLGIAQITFPVGQTERMIAKNNALLLLLAVVTAFIATLAAYAMIRYVIVKPLLHLREVSDAVYKGDLDQRADIQTNDDFEDLSLAFNRMLRHLVQMQEEQKQIVSEQERNMAQVARANLGLYEANRMKNEFLATVTHELRTPLNSILGFSELLKSAENLTERQAKYAANIDKSGRGLLSLINDILDIAKIEAGKMGRNVSKFDLRDLIDQEMSTIEPLANKKNISLTTSFPDLPLELEQDRRKLKQILINLLSNAVKFTPEGGRVAVHVSVSEPQVTSRSSAIGRSGEAKEKAQIPESVASVSAASVVIRVVDTGIGIPLEDQERIFEKFRQAKMQNGDALARDYEGTGLGLSIVKELCKLLGGEVSLTSEFGKGSEFQVEIPVAVPPLDEVDVSVRFSDPHDESDTNLTSNNEAATPLAGEP